MGERCDQLPHWIATRRELLCCTALRHDASAVDYIIAS